MVKKLSLIIVLVLLLGVTAILQKELCKRSICTLVFDKANNKLVLVDNTKLTSYLANHAEGGNNFLSIFLLNAEGKITRVDQVRHKPVIVILEVVTEKPQGYISVVRDQKVSAKHEVGWIKPEDRGLYILINIALLYPPEETIALVIDPDSKYYQKLKGKQFSVASIAFSRALAMLNEGLNWKINFDSVDNDWTMLKI